MMAVIAPPSEAMLPPHPPGLGKRTVSFADSLGKELEKVQEFDLTQPPSVIQRRKSSLMRMLELNLSPVLTRQILPLRRELSTLPLRRELSTQFLRQPERPTYQRVMSAPTQLSERGPAWEVQFTLDNLVGGRQVSKEQPVCLSFARYQPDRIQLTGSIAALNLGYEKSVFVRYSFDDWKTFADAEAYFSWGDTKADSGVDFFTFHIPIEPRCLVVGKRIHFAIGYTVGLRTYWDNNNWRNYLVVAHSTEEPSSPCVPLLAKDSTVRLSRNDLLKAFEFADIDSDDFLTIDEDLDPKDRFPHPRSHPLRNNPIYEEESSDDEFDFIQLKIDRTPSLNGGKKHEEHRGEGLVVRTGHLGKNDIIAEDPSLSRVDRALGLRPRGGSFRGGMLR